MIRQGEFPDELVDCNPIAGPTGQFHGRNHARDQAADVVL